MHVKLLSLTSSFPSAFKKIRGQPWCYLPQWMRIENCVPCPSRLRTIKRSGWSGFSTLDQPLQYVGDDDHASTFPAHIAIILSETHNMPDFASCLSVNAPLSRCSPFCQTIDMLAICDRYYGTDNFQTAIAIHATYVQPQE